MAAVAEPVIFHYAARHLMRAGQCTATASADSRIHEPDVVEAISRGQVDKPLPVGRDLELAAIGVRKQHGARDQRGLLGRGERRAEKEQRESEQ